ncbi:MAG: hypothetical protein AAFO94_17215, partial [Bacteroidota bacterium]
LKQYKAPFEIPKATARSSCMWIEIPAGSNNALTSAIDAACEGGIIYLRAGEHTETERLTITKSVKIIGEAGAVLKLKSELAPYSEQFTISILPGIHIKDAPGTLIQDLIIEPVDSDGGSAILIENSNYAAVMRSEISNFQFAIVVEKSDFPTIMLNKIMTTNKWRTGEVQEANSIVNITGESSYIADNEVSNAFTGIWACGKYGTCERNYTHSGNIGVLLCNVPPYLVMPDGRVTGSETPGTEWKLRNNKSNDNSYIGYLVIDGANNNQLDNNEASNNAAYDIEIAAESNRFGFTTPEAYNNTVNVGNYPNIRIKNCGPGNTINGGVLIDNSTDPCN